jgi:hypothetical protein
VKRQPFKVQKLKSKPLMNPNKHNPDGRKIWFPVKRYGWGWGPPCCWQGWVALGSWLAALAGGAFLLLPRHPLVLLVWVTGLILVWFIILLLKGEKPGWHWGGK